MPMDLAPAPLGRRGSHRVALRQARRDIARHKGRSRLIILLIMLPVAGMTGAATLYQSSQRMPGEIVSYDAAVVVDLGLGDDVRVERGRLTLPDGITWVTA